MTTSTWTTTLSPDVDAFFAEYAARGANPDADSGEHFAEEFLTLDPNQARVLARGTLVAALPARRQLFAKAGIGPLQLADASQLDLDARHVLVRAAWTAERTGAQRLRIESTFLLRRDEGRLRIVVYLNHHDMVALLSQPAAR
ncbi:hypothetical protein [Rugosimonospora africana]|uniref:SnoaL-like domain-containing protein n=1 Tax=Rugosimonospora africana TaxID=556532 RepID=A0A8J3VVN2_9ACTN|nr:hypothetical protein [Rugosimonospora africana]GIH20847.1 hypothetical protein Raf01_90190 [Rugosimonospora africana]